MLAYYVIVESLSRTGSGRCTWGRHVVKWLFFFFFSLPPYCRSSIEMPAICFGRRLLVTSLHLSTPSPHFSHTPHYYCRYTRNTTTVLHYTPHRTRCDTSMHRALKLSSHRKRYDAPRPPRPLSRSAHRRLILHALPLAETTLSSRGVDGWVGGQNDKGTVPT